MPSTSPCPRRRPARRLARGGRRRPRRHQPHVEDADLDLSRQSRHQDRQRPDRSGHPAAGRPRNGQASAGRRPDREPRAHRPAPREPRPRLNAAAHGERLCRQGGGRRRDRLHPEALRTPRLADHRRDPPLDRGDRRGDHGASPGRAARTLGNLSGHGADHPRLEKPDADGAARRRRHRLRSDAAVRSTSARRSAARRPPAASPPEIAARARRSQGARCRRSQSRRAGHRRRPDARIRRAAAPQAGVARGSPRAARSSSPVAATGSTPPSPASAEGRVAWRTSRARRLTIRPLSAAGDRRLSRAQSATRRWRASAPTRSKVPAFSSSTGSKATISPSSACRSCRFSIGCARRGL